MESFRHLLADPVSRDLFFAFLAPVVVLYLLVFIGFYERVRKRLKYGESSSPIFSVRDAAIATLALDVVALVEPYHGQSMVIESLGAASLLIALLIIHLFLLRRVQTFTLDESRSHGALTQVMSLYFGMLLLISNGVTVKAMLGSLGVIP